MGYKSRTVYKTFCLKVCKNRDILCDECYRFSHFEEMPKGEQLKDEDNKCEKQSTQRT